MDTTIVKNDVTHQNWFNLQRVNVEDNTGAIKELTVRKVAGLPLIERKIFIKHVETRGITDRLVRAGQLTPYHSNGQPKDMSAGKAKNTRTFYDLREWREIDFNSVEY